MRAELAELQAEYHLSVIMEDQDEDFDDGDEGDDHVVNNPDTTTITTVDSNNPDWVVTETLLPDGVTVDPAGKIIAQSRNEQLSGSGFLRVKSVQATEASSTQPDLLNMPLATE